MRLLATAILALIGSSPIFAADIRLNDKGAIEVTGVDRDQLASYRSLDQGGFRILFPVYTGST